MTSNPQTEARAIYERGISAGGQFSIVDEIATALAAKDAELAFAEKRAKDAELAEAASALWRIPPNTHTIPCEINGFVEPDPFEGAGETYADAYTREKSRAERAEAQLAEANKALDAIIERSRDVSWSEAEYVRVALDTRDIARRAREAYRR